MKIRFYAYQWPKFSKREKVTRFQLHSSQSLKLSQDFNYISHNLIKNILQKCIFLLVLSLPALSKISKSRLSLKKSLEKVIAPNYKIRILEKRTKHQGKAKINAIMLVSHVIIENMSKCIKIYVSHTFLWPLSTASLLVILIRREKQWDLHSFYKNQ